MSVQGYVPESGRGTLSGTVTGIPDTFEAVLHWYNDKAQYWTKARDGKYASPAMKPGTYTMKLYRGEFPVASDTVTISAGGTASKDIASSEGGAAAPSVIWRIGDFDGRPQDLRNGDKIERMHPADVRMGPWGGNYTVGSSTAAADFPMALFAKQGGTATVGFQLAKDQVADAVLRISTTLSFKGGRPSVKINSGWTGKDPGAPVGYFQPQPSLVLVLFSVSCTNFVLCRS